MRKLKEVRCPMCSRKLYDGKVEHIEIKCKKCKSLLLISGYEISIIDRNDQKM